MDKRPEPPPVKEEDYGGCRAEPESVFVDEKDMNGKKIDFEGLKEEKSSDKDDDAVPEPLKIIDPTAWQNQPVPERQWLVPGLIPLHNVTLLAGDGGLGKSILAMQLMAACALGEK